MALDFSPISGADRVRYASQGNFNSGAKSIVCDFYPDVSTMSNNYIFSAHVSGGTGLVNFLLQMGTSGGTGSNHIRAASFGGTTCEITSAAGVTTNAAWNQIGFTWDGTSKYSAGSGNLYCNSSTALTPATAGTTGSFGSTAGDWHVGNNGNANRAPDGRIGRFAVLNREFTTAEFDLFLLGLPVRSIWLDSDFLLVPNTDFNDNWNDDVNSVTATITGASQIADATFPGSTIMTAETKAVGLTINDATTSVGSDTTLVAETLAIGLTINDATTTKSGTTLVAETLAVGLTINDANLHEITLDDSSECTSADVSASTISGTEADPVINLDFHRNLSSQWVSGVVRVNNVVGKTSVTLKFDDSTRGTAFNSAQPIWQRLESGDYDDWVRVASDTLSGSELTAVVSSGLTGDLLVANQPAVFPSDIEAYFAAKIAASSHVTSLVTGEETTGKYATLVATTGYNSKVIPSLDQHAIQITDSALDPVSFPVGAKPHILVILNNHPHEHIGAQSVIGLIEWLTGADADAVLARRNFVWHVVQVNPQGVWGANQNSGSWQSGQANTNTNREWDSSLITCVNNAKTYIANDIGTSNIKFVVDFHNLISGNGTGTDSSIFMIDTRPNTQNFFDQFQIAYTGATVLENAGSTDAGIAANYYYNTFSIPGVTMEQDQCSDVLLSDYRGWGQAAGEAIQAMAVAGDFGEFILAETLSIGLTINDVTTTHDTPNVTMTADTLAIGLTINDATTQRAITLPIETLAVGLTLNDVTFNRTFSRTLEAETLAIGLTIHDATLIDSITAAREGLIGVDMRRHIELKRGQSVTIKGVARDEDGNRINITNDTLTWKVGSNDLKETIITLTEGDGITKTDATRGEWKITLAGAKTVNQPPGYYRHQGEGTFSDLPYGFVSGRFWLRRDLP